MTPADKQKRDDGSVKIMIHLFKDMCDTVEELADNPENHKLVSLTQFVGWMQGNLNLKNGVEICNELGVPPESWEFVQTVADTGNVMQILSVWPRVLLHGRPVPKNPVRHIHLLPIVEWEDGKIMPLSIFTPREFAPNATLTDGMVAALFQQQVQAIVGQIAEMTLDGIHEHSADSYGGDAHFDVLMGAMLQVIPQLKQEHQVYVHKWMRLVQAIIRPPMPEHVKAHVKAVRERMNQRDQQVRGGWRD